MDTNESDLATNTTSVESETNTNQNTSLNGSGNELNEIEKLQVSSEWENDDDGEKVSPVRSRKKREMRILDSDSDDDEESSENKQDEGGDEKDFEATKEQEVKDSRVESETDQEDAETANEKQQPVAANYKSLIDPDTESESDESEKDDEVKNEDEESDDGESPKQSEESEELKASRGPVPIRMSAKAAMEQMKSIKSETQRLTRENYISIPYHKPKQYSLKEFMNRKSLSKPDLRASKKPLSLKMSREELIEYAKNLEERAEEAKDFFKSDSEEEDEEKKYLPTKEETTDPIIDKKHDDVEVPETQQNDIEQSDLPGKRKTEVDGSSEIEADESEIEVPETEAVESEMDAPNTRADEMEIDVPETEVKDTAINIPETVAKDDQRDAPEIEEGDVADTEEKDTEINVEAEETELPGTRDIDPSTESTTINNIKELLKEHDVTMSPMLHGSPNMMIDLETGAVVKPEPSGVDQLFQRFLNHSAKRKPKEQTNMRILSTDNGIIELTNVNVTLTETQNTEQKPGAAYFKLKNDLKKVMLKKRKEELMKRVQENACSDKENEDFDDEEDEFDCSEKAKCLDDEEYVDELDEEQDDEVGHDDAIKDGAEKQDDADELDYEEDENLEADDEYDSDESGEDENDLPEVTKQIKNRIITAFDDSDDENEEKEKPCDSILANDNNLPLWNEEPKQQSDCEDELLGLCSGRFGPTQKNLAISQIPTTQLTQTTDENELLALCSGKFQESTQVTIPESTEKNEQMTLNAQLETSDEEEEKNVPLPAEKSKPKKKRKLSYSDDDENDIEESGQTDKQSEDVDEESAHEEDIAEDVPATYVDYDSEENEIEVQMTKKECRLKANDFVENEAELSESEWGSADEDEKGLDRYDIDLADEEEFDKDKLQTELGKIHMRRLLDDDIREVKKIQELLFEDEEMDGVGRQRQFKWKNTESGFSLETEGGADGDGKQGSDEENDELLWRKMRHEREVLLKETSVTVDDSSVEKKSLQMNSTIIHKKLTIVNINSTNTTPSEVSSPFLIAKSATSNRGSFLIRDKDTLSRLASITKSSMEQDGGVATVQIKSGKAKNFVFATISSVEPENVLKRKSVNSETDVEFNQKKKLKMNTKTKLQLIDHLA